MGRKKKKVMKPWCWYCNREFDDEKVLIQHQKAKHFKCHLCNKKLFTGPGLVIHCMQVHKETIDKIPGAIQGRDSIDVEVYGMEGIPQEYGGGSSEPKAKKAALSAPTPAAPIVPSAFPAQGFPPMPPMPMPAPYVTGQFFGARPQFPGMPLPNQLGFPTRIPGAFPPTIPHSTAAFAAAMNPASIPIPSSIPTPSSIPLPTALPNYQAPANILPGTSGDLATSIPIPSSSTSAQQQPVIPQKSLGSKTRIVVPDENISLEEHMANRLELLSQVRYHH